MESSPAPADPPSLIQRLARSDIEFHETFFRVQRALERIDGESLRDRSSASNAAWPVAPRVSPLDRTLAKLCPAAIVRPLSAYELFILSCASLVYLPPPDGEGGPRSALREQQALERLRAIEAEDAGLSRHDVAIVGELCEAFWRGGQQRLRRSVSVDPHGVVRVSFLASLMRLASALDLLRGKLPAVIRDRAIAASRNPPSSKQLQALSDVAIEAYPAWDILLVVPGKVTPRPYFELQGYVQDELDSVQVELRAQGVYFNRVELRLSQQDDHGARTLSNPFLRLEAFSPKTAGRFGGREREAQQLLEMVYRRRLIILMGESGVGKSSLVEAGLVPALDKSVRVVRFSCQWNPFESLMHALQASDDEPKKGLVEAVDDFVRARSGVRNVLLIGDHLEQMFTVPKGEGVRRRFVEEAGRLLASQSPGSFLFCLREDYLPDLHTLSPEIPEVYE